MPKILYPSFSLPPIQPAQAVANTTQGGICVFPHSTTRRNPQQPQGDILPPGRFTTTNTTQGGLTFAPETTRGPIRQQPQGEILAPGQFTTTNTTQGGVCLSPPTAIRLVPQQPQGEILPPGRFTTTNTRFGGENVYPAKTWAKAPQQPDAHTWVPGVFAGVTPFVIKGWEPFFPATTIRLNPQQPQGEILTPGRFTTTNTTQGGAAFFPATTWANRPQQLQGKTLVPLPRPPGPQGWDTAYPLATRDSGPRQSPPLIFVPFKPPVLPNTQQGGITLAPDRTYRLYPQQPESFYWCPGNFIGVTPVPPIPPIPPVPPSPPAPPPSPPPPQSPSTPDLLAPEIHAFDIGTDLVLTVVDQDRKLVNISAATTLTIRLTPPLDKPIMIRTGVIDTNGVDGRFKYTTVAGDLFLEGTWSIQGTITLPLGTWTTATATFLVLPVEEK